jgi:hypothetical protein
MSRTAWFGLVVLAVAAAGCGGALSGGAGGAGGSGGAMTGAAGTSGVSDAAGPGGSPFNGDYVWGDVAIHVGPIAAVPFQFLLQESDPAAPGTLISTVSLPPATRFSPSDGAYVIAHFGCGLGTLYQVDIYSCANGGVTGGTTMYGCIGVSFSPSGITGNFLGNDGVRCDVRGGTATVNLSPPTFVAPTDGWPPAPAASGTFLLDCASSDGTQRLLESKFEVLLDWQLLLC